MAMFGCRFFALTPTGAGPQPPAALRAGCQNIPHADQRVRHHSESHPTFHPFGAAIAASSQAVTPFQDTDAALTTGAPALRFLEPAAVFLLLPVGTFRIAIRHRHPFHALLLDRL